MPLRHGMIAGVGALLLLMSISWAGAADRDARVITPDGSPVWLDPWRALLVDSPGVVVILENRHAEPLASALRTWIFDPELRLKGSVDYCTSEVLDRNTRGTVMIPLDIPGVTLRDRAVVTVAAAGGGGGLWTLRGTEIDQLAAARAAARGSGARLVMDRENGRPGSWGCPCDARAFEGRCAERCAAAGVASHEATRLLYTGCSTSCACR